MKPFISIFFLILLVVLGCVSHKSNQMDYTDPREERIMELEKNMEGLSDNNPAKIAYNRSDKDSIIFTISITDSNYWNIVTPLQFVDTLSKYHNGFKFIVHTRPNANWLDKSNTRKLKRFLNNTNKCASVIYLAPEISPFAQVKCQSNIGQEVKYMFECFKSGGYPNSRSSCEIENKKAANNK